MNFRILGLDPAPFAPLYGLSDAALAEQGVQRIAVNEPHSAPDRIELRDAEPGETVLLLNHCYLDIPNPYYGRHAIFVREGATQRFEALNQVPDALRRRLLSLRAFDAASMMVDADVVEGTQIEGLIERLFAEPAAAFIQVHHARRGCYAARVERG
ncbi:hypothetical protein HNQ51_002264 [Inhella inkyongensis]|uniref:DUF1203 domain-containing protein n=1 Tax=Inhella inkyongensis TaxID=392593 RepID=A0A840S3M4_9BURK|nr:DUF1203 domain-containing protein [Inhella inkyongensis]MBB5204945.1 hypothetical protein [Inhella inkyongensis]